MRPPRRAGEGPLCQGWGGSLPTESSKWRAKEPLTAPLSSRPPSVKRALNQNLILLCHRAVGIPLYHQVGSMGWRVMTNPDIPKLETPCGHSAPSSINSASWSSKSKAAQKLGERRADGGGKSYLRVSRDAQGGVCLIICSCRFRAGHTIQNTRFRGFYLHIFIHSRKPYRDFYLIYVYYTTSMP